MNDLTLEEMTRRAIKQIESSKETIRNADSKTDFRSKYSR